MTRRDDLEKTIKDLQSALDKAQWELKNLNNYERFVPKVKEEYYYIDEKGYFISRINDESFLDYCTIATYNCFRTNKEALKEKEKILVRRQLEGIANRLNKGKKIDFENSEIKYCVAYYVDCLGETGGLFLSSNIDLQCGGVVYCLSQDFLRVAIEEIGEERLIEYIKGE